MKLVIKNLSAEDERLVKKLYKWMRKQGLSYGEAQNLLNVMRNALNDSKRRYRTQNCKQEKGW